jgi:hypothetical protein
MHNWIGKKHSFHDGEYVASNFLIFIFFASYKIPLPLQKNHSPLLVIVKSFSSRIEVSPLLVGAFNLFPLKPFPLIVHLHPLLQ